MSVGNRIRKRRTELKISQRDLASKLGYSDHTTVTRIEADKVDVSQSRLKQFAKVLDVSVGYLMGWEESPEEAGALAAATISDPRIKKLVSDYLTLDEEDKNIITSLMASLVTKRKDRPEGRS